MRSARAKSGDGSVARVARRDGIGRDIACHHGICADDRTVPDVHAGQHGNVLPDSHIISHNGIPFERQFIGGRS